MPIPKDHISLLIADGRRAVEWKLGLQKEGVRAQAIETSGSEAAKGDFWLVVPKEDRFVGQRFVTEVLAGRRELPRSAPVSGPLLWGAWIIVLSIAGLFVAALLS